MPLSRRYSPEWAAGESNSIGIDLSAVIPPGVGIASASLVIFTNSAVPQDVSTTDWVIGPVNISGRTVYAQLDGGANGRDYQLRWTAVDTDSNVWQRTALMLCSLTS